MTVNMMNVESSNIRRVGYNPENKRLYIQFKSGATYRYSNVEPKTYAELIGSVTESIGKAFQSLIKAQAERYPYLKLDLEPEEDEEEQA